MIWLVPPSPGDLDTGVYRRWTVGFWWLGAKLGPLTVGAWRPRHSLPGLRARVAVEASWSGGESRLLWPLRMFGRHWSALYQREES